MRSRVLFFALVTSALFFSGVMAQAATIIVTSGGDSGGGTLRQAILDAASGDTINFAAGLSTINLTSGELLINKNLTISGPGANLLTVRRSTDGIPADAPGFRIFNIASGNFNVALSGLTITRGSDVNFGGGIFNLSTGAVTITNCIISGNGASSFSGSNTSGGAIYNSGTVTITNSTISGNSASTSSFGPSGSSNGGGIYNSGTLTITNSTISGNSASSSSGRPSGNSSNGGGIYNTGTVTVTNSTISGNSVGSGSSSGSSNVSSTGGGVSGGTVTITNSTISGNSAFSSNSSGGSNSSSSSRGGGVFGDTVTITNSTISGNSVSSFSGFTGGASSGGGGISGGTVIARNTIIAKNTAQNGGPDVYGPLSSQGYNLIGNGADATITPAQSTDQIGTASSPIDPRLGPLQDNGGPTFTHALLNSSPAIDKGGGGTGITTDQRGRPRPVRYDASIPEPAGGDGSDIGAFEVSPVQFDAPNYTVAENGGSVVVSVSRSGDTSQSASVHYATSDGTATAGSDYASTSGDLTFAPGQTSKTFSVQILDDNTYEGEETFTVTLSSPMGADLGRLVAVVTIVENDPAPKLLNISSRSHVQTGDNVMIGGFIITGNTPKPVVLRGLGPSLVNAGIPAATVLNDPVLELHGASGALITSNDNWKDSSQRAQIEGTVFQPSDDREAVILATLPPAGYTAIVRGKDSSSGVGLVEIYDVDQSGDSTLANISTRALVATGNDVLIGGFILGGANGSVTIIVRAIGPSLAQSGVSNPLPDPLLELRDGNGTLIASDDNWNDNPSQASQLMQAGLQPQSNLEAAIAATLPPGSYTAIVAGKNGAIGVGLVEVYNLQ